MSKSLNRVRLALEQAGVPAEIRETPLARTAADAATALNCDVHQIAKSIVFCTQQSNTAVLFLTAGGHRVDSARAAALAGEPLGKADAALIRTQTGFAIGGVAPIGHLSPIRAWMDPKLLTYEIVWAAAGTPHHVFCIEPHVLMRISGAQNADFTSQSQLM